MSIVAQCTNCGKKYKVAETSVGKQVRCQACQTTFTVQAAVAVAAGANAAGSKPTARTGQAARPASSSNNAKQMELAQRFGLAPLPPNENTVFSETPYQRPANQHDPLANHLVYDPGFAPVSVADYHATQVPKEQSMHDYMKQIEDEENEEQRWKQRSKRKKTNRTSQDPRPMYLILGLGPFAALFTHLLLSVAGVPTIGIVFYFSSLAAMVIVANYYVFREIFSDTSEEIMKCMIIPGYILYYTFANWSYMKHPFLATLLFPFSVLASLLLAFAFVVLLGMTLRMF